jgi:hypothetical protein
VCIGIYPHRVEQRGIPQRAVNFPMQDRTEINGPGYPIIKLYLYDKGPNDLERADRMDWMAHGLFSLMKRLDLQRRSASLQSLPVVQQLSLMDFGPRFHEALLPTWQATSNQFDPVDGDHCDIILAIGMKVGSVMLHERLHKNSPHDNKLITYSMSVAALLSS